MFDDGVGFRYEFPDSAGQGGTRITDELTEFVIAGEGTAWWIPAGDWNRYEYTYNETSDRGNRHGAHADDRSAGEWHAPVVS